MTVQWFWRAEELYKVSESSLEVSPPLFLCSSPMSVSSSNFLFIYTSSLLTIPLRWGFWLRSFGNFFLGVPSLLFFAFLSLSLPSLSFAPYYFDLLSVLSLFASLAAVR